MRAIVDIELVLVNEKLKDTALSLIKAFWLCHNNEVQTADETLEDYNSWTASGHLFYLIKLVDKYIGFAHLASRGAQIDWLEDLFILPEYQRRGFGSQAVTMLETKVKQYSESLYIEVAARNLQAIKLYRKLGYDCLNTITIRKDFDKDKYNVKSQETITGMDFVIKDNC
jgi:ribosomal protein S18 acetylase RimI-like enzyme